MGLPPFAYPGTARRTVAQRAHSAVCALLSALSTARLSLTAYGSRLWDSAYAYRPRQREHEHAREDECASTQRVSKCVDCGRPCVLRERGKSMCNAFEVKCLALLATCSPLTTSGRGIRFESSRDNLSAIPVPARITRARCRAIFGGALTD